jgi:hypothetical protein
MKIHQPYSVNLRSLKITVIICCSWLGLLFIPGRCSQTPADFRRTTRRYNLEDWTLQQPRLQNRWDYHYTKWFCDIQRGLSRAGQRVSNQALWQCLHVFVTQRVKASAEDCSGCRILMSTPVIEFRHITVCANTVYNYTSVSQHM